MSKLKEFFKSPHIQIALATGVSIIALAYFSKRVLSEPIGYLPAAIPPFIAFIFESVLSKHKNKKIATTWYWVAAVLCATALIIIVYAI
jgi:branched-subunit amino acid transport protein